MSNFDMHESGQLRIGVAGDPIELLLLNDKLIPASTGDQLASPELARETQYRVWLSSSGGAYWIPGRGTDEATVLRNLTRTQRKRVRSIKQIHTNTREATK